MHRAGRILRTRQPFGKPRTASTAAKPKGYYQQEETQGYVTRQTSPANGFRGPLNTTAGPSSQGAYRGPGSPNSASRDRPPHRNDRPSNPNGSYTWNRKAGPPLSSLPPSLPNRQARPAGPGKPNANPPRQLKDFGNQDRRTNQPKAPVASWISQPEVPVAEDGPEGDFQRMRDNGTSRLRRDKFKEKDRASRFMEHPAQSSANSPNRKPVNMRPEQGNATKPKPKRVNTIRRPVREIYIPSTVTVGAFANILKIKIDRLQRRIVDLGLTDKPTYDYRLTSDYASLIAEEFNCKPVIDDEAAFDLFPPPPHPEPTSLPLRPPVVTIMGHVDHGKTTLLDTLRSSSVAKGEAGGITQHIGAFSVPVKTESGDYSSTRSITFLDTPGHAAFSAMRARGAGVTDIIVLVVAADDGIMPQTREVIELYKKCQDSVGLVVAINKVDKPAADVESVEKALMAEGIQLESYGGDIPAVYVSGLTGQGLPELVETLSALAEMQDLRAEQDGFAFGEILESRVQKGLGFIGTALILRGSLKTGSHIVSGSNYAKVRIMTDSTGAAVKKATPGMAVTVSGWKTLPKAGDNVIEGSESDVKKALTNRIRQAEIEASLSDVDAINESRRVEREVREAEVAQAAKNKGRQTRLTRTPAPEHEEASGPKELRLLIKADVSGSAEAVEGALQGIGNKIAMSKIIQTGVGDVTETDVMMAKTANATIIAFSVGVPRSIQNLAAQNGVPISESKIIYKLMDDVRDRVRALLPPIIETKVTGEANVLQLFDIQLKDKSTKKVAGCRVSNGLVEKSKNARVVRNGETIHEGTLETMRHLKKDVTEVRKGTECGLSLVDFTDLKEGDLIQMFEKIEKPGLL